MRNADTIGTHCLPYGICLSSLGPVRGKIDRLPGVLAMASLAETGQPLGSKLSLYMGCLRAVITG
jgi:hypothetical protein